MNPFALIVEKLYLRYKPQFVFSTWLYRLTLNLSIDFLRKRNRHRSVSLQDLPDESGLKDNHSIPEDPLEQKELRGAIQRISGGLIQNQRKVFVLRLGFFDLDWLKQNIEQGKINIKHERRDDVIVLTAQTKKLQEFVLAHVEEAFPFEKEGLYRFW